MLSISPKSLLAAGAILAAGVGLAGTANAQSNTSSDVKSTPFNYVIKDGKPVPKGNRIKNPDGSWREEIRQGKCVTIKEGSAQGDVKITRRCD